MKLRGAVVDGPLVISNVTVSYPLTFERCTFPRGFDLSSTMFTRSFWLTNSRVGGVGLDQEPPTLAGARFAGADSSQRRA